MGNATLFGLCGAIYAVDQQSGDVSSHCLFPLAVKMSFYTLFSFYPFLCSKVVYLKTVTHDNTHIE